MGKADRLVRSERVVNMTATQPENPDFAGLIDGPGLTAWLDKTLPQFGDGKLAGKLLAGGMSNAVFRLERGGDAFVLRRPPRVPRPDSVKIIAREAQLLKALAGTDVPHPKFHAYCDDASVIGAPFYIMAMVDGWVGYEQGRPYPEPFDKGENHRLLPFALVDAVARLANVDYKAVGLEGFGKPEGFLERQVDRWRTQMESYRQAEDYAGRELPGYDYAGDWLRANTPKTTRYGIIHGDYSLANALIAWDTPPRVAAMIDWELSTVGDPLLDLGWLLYAYRGRDEKTPPSGYFDASTFPYREELAEHYAAQTNLPIDNLTYYMVLAQYKLATIMERHYARGLSGKQTGEASRIAGDFVLRLAAKAAEMARAAG
jgi:aminoglycoside phosphotransferase (APT) family kinase protein